MREGEVKWQAKRDAVGQHFTSPERKIILYMGEWSTAIPLDYIANIVSLVYVLCSRFLSAETRKLKAMDSGYPLTA